MILQKVLTYGGRIITVSSIALIIVMLAKHAADIPPFRFGAFALVSVTSTILFLILCSVLGSVAWIVLLHGGNLTIGVRDAYIILGKSQIQKYFVGNVFHYISRVTIGSKKGLPVEAIILSMGVETAVAAFTSFVLALAGSMVLREDIWRILTINRISDKAWMLEIVVVLAIAAMAGVSFSKPARRWIKERLSYFYPSRVLTASALLSCFNVLIGLFITLILRSFWNIESGQPWYYYSWGFTIAWLLGFLVPGASGGIGVREAVMIGIFSSGIGIGAAVGLAVVLRILTSCADLISFSIASFLDRRPMAASDK